MAVPTSSRTDVGRVSVRRAGTPGSSGSQGATLGPVEQLDEPAGRFFEFIQLEDASKGFENLALLLTKAFLRSTSEPFGHLAKGGPACAVGRVAPGDQNSAFEGAELGVECLDATVELGAQETAFLVGRHGGDRVVLDEDFRREAVTSFNHVSDLRTGEWCRGCLENGPDLRPPL